MPIGIGAAMLIGSAASAGGAVAASKIQSNAAKKAQQEQQKGTDKALQVQQQQTAPYRALGEAAVGRLGQLTANAQPYTQVFGSGRGAQGQPGQPQQGPGSMGGPPTPPPMGLGALGQPSQGPGTGQPPGGMQPPAQAMQRPPMGQSGPAPMGMPQRPGVPPTPQSAQMVTIRHPSGQVQQMPAADAQRYLSMGAQRVG